MDEMNHVIKENPYLQFDKRKLDREKPKKKKSFNHIRIDPADEVFSIFIRIRDGRCVRCRRPGTADRFGRMIKGLQCSHYFGRGRESTRFDSENADALCFGCHKIWGSEDKEGYRNFKIKQLGEDGFQKLDVRQSLPQKKDRKMDLMYWRERIKKDFDVSEKI